MLVVPVYTRAFEGSISQTLNADTIMPVEVGLVITKFAHDTSSKTDGVRAHGLTSEFLDNWILSTQQFTPRASVAITNYSLKNNPNINRTILGSGLDIDFTVNIPSSMFGYEANHRITPFDILQL